MELYRKENNSISRGWISGRKKISTKFDIWKQHPSEVTSLIETDLRIYTDGPENEEGDGAAFQIGARKIKLPKYSNNFEAAGVAILKAMKYIQTLGEDQCIQIVTDSLSSPRALANPGNQNELINLIKEKYRTVRE